jgi:hypothetical protein
MTEAAADGAGTKPFDLKTSKIELSTSSTARRIAQLAAIEDSLTQKGNVEEPYYLEQRETQTNFECYSPRPPVHCRFTQDPLLDSCLL